MRLSDYEKKMLDGHFGALKRQAMAKTLDYAAVVGAERLCDVSMAHLFCGAHPYLEVCDGDGFEAVVSEMSFCSKEKLDLKETAAGVVCQADVTPLSTNNWQAMSRDQHRFSRNKEYLARYAAMGVNLVGTCVPYLAGFVPVKGQHYVSSESHAVLLMNTLWAAAGQADGIEAGFWAAACGKTPYWGLHDPANRGGTHLFSIDVELNTVFDWDLFGHAAGRKIPPRAVPVFKEGFVPPDVFKLKSSFAAMATTSGAELSHFVGFSPEAPTPAAAFGGESRIPKEMISITARDMEDSRQMLDCGQSEAADYISLGCPHFAPHQLREVAAFLEGKKVRKKVHIWTAPPFKEVADRSGLTETIEAAGAELLAGTCPLVSECLPEGIGSMAFDSAKQAHYMKSSYPDKKVLYGSTLKCLQSALDGRWEGGA